LDSPILELQGVSVRFGDTVALQDVSFRLQAQERIAIIGPNGAGKSTLFNVISGVLRPNRGVVNIFGHGPDNHICIAYVPQRSRVDWHFPVNVADVVMMGRTGKLGLLHRPKKQDWAVVYQALDLVDMRSLAKRQIGELSGGQQQRVFIARALAQEAELMLMDEPLTGLDVKSQEGIFGVLDKLRDFGVTLLVATHDLNLAAERFDRLMLLNQRMIGFGKADAVLTPAALNEAYSGSMRLVNTPDGTVAISDSCCSHSSERWHG
jgi:manganese/iron transport system ATP-binding protein